MAEKFSISNIKERFKNFLFTNQFLRKVRNFFHQSFLPFLFKCLLGFIALLAIIIITIKIFKPAYIETAHQKISFYFFHYLNLDNQELGKVTITGNKRTTTEEILAIVTETHKAANNNKFQDYQPLIQRLVIEIKKQLPWINKVVITRSMPNLLNITVTEYEPFAIWQKGDKKYITDKDGNIVLIEDLTEFENLIILSGNEANNHVNSLFNIFVADPNLSSHVYSATWSGDRRWDIRFDNGLLIKLPENNISEAWNNLIKIYNTPGSILGLNVIDLRVEGKIYLEYGDSVIKEIKSL